MKTDSQILEGMGVMKGDGKKKKVWYTALLFLISPDSNIAQHPNITIWGSRAGRDSQGQQALSRRW